MKLYHGSNIEVRNIDLDKCRPYKDFGKGFYLTDLKDQASRMAQRVAKLSKGRPVVSTFEFDLEEARCNSLNIKIFESPSLKWAKFVIRNRDIRTPQPSHDFDIVIGPVADDTISRLLRLYLDSLISDRQLLQELTFSEISSQYFFHTQKAVNLLKRI